MAQDTQFQRYLNEPGFSPSPIVKKLGGRDNALLTLAELGTAGLEVGAEFRKQNVLEGIDADTKALEQEYLLDSPTYSKEQGQIAIGDEFMYNEGSDQFSPESAGEEHTTKVEGKFKERLEYLQNAMKQGTMTQFEFGERARRVAREYIATNPHLTREILGRLSQNFELSGIQERLKLDQDYFAAQAKMQQNAQEAFNDEQKKLQKMLDDVGSSYTEYMDAQGYFIRDKVIRKHDIIRTAQEAEAALNLAAKSGEHVSKLDIQQFTQNGGPAMMNIAFDNKIKMTVNSILNQPGSWDQKKTAIQLALQDIETEVDTTYGKYASDSVIKGTIDGIKTKSKDLLAIIDADQNGTNTKTYLETREAINNAVDNDELRRAVGNPKAIEFLMKAAQTPGIAGLMRAENKNLYSGILSRILTAVDGARLGATDLTQTEPNKPESSIAAHAFTILGANAAQGDKDAITKLGQNVTDRVGAINNLEKDVDRYVASRDFISQLANPQNKSSVDILDQQGKSSALQVITDVNSALFKNLKNSTEDDGINFTFTEDGLIMASGASKEFNKKFLEPINESLKAYANLTGSSTKVASNDFFTQFYQGQFEAPAKVSMKDQASEVYTNIKKADSSFSISPVVARKPRIDGVTPVDFTKTGKDLEEDKTRFATEYAEAAYKVFGGDQHQKVAASLYSSIQDVSTAVEKAKKQGKPDTWTTYLPEGVGNKLMKSAVAPDVRNLNINDKVEELYAAQDKIKTANPEVFKSFGFESKVERAKDIAEDLTNLYKTPIAWEYVLKAIEDREAWKKDRPTASGKIKRANPKVATPPDFPRVNAKTQGERDSKRKQILQDELASEKAALAEAQKTGNTDLIKSHQQNIKLLETDLKGMK
jgi:hypothetical protein